MTETTTMTMYGPDRDKIIQAARDKYHEAGRIEVDYGTSISQAAGEEGCEGCYVKAWVWVNFEEDIAE